jgi:hypothetical protein
VYEPNVILRAMYVFHLPERYTRPVALPIVRRSKAIVDINSVDMSRGSNAAHGGEVAGSLGGVGREAPFLPRRQGGGHQAGVREPASIG